MVSPVSVSPLVVQEYPSASPLASPSAVRGLPSAEAGAGAGVAAEARTPAPGLAVQELAVPAWGYRLAPVLA
jgi:hypothetical protein